MQVNHKKESERETEELEILQTQKGSDLCSKVHKYRLKHRFIQSAQVVLLYFHVKASRVLTAGHPELVSAISALRASGLRARPHCLEITSIKAPLLRQNVQR